MSVEETGQEEGKAFHSLAAVLFVNHLYLFF